MTDPRQLSIESFDYLLPAEKIAAFPTATRDSSRLLVWKQDVIREDIFSNINVYLPPDSLMVFNNTRVVEARILFRKPTGARIEVFCLEPSDLYTDVAAALARRGSVTWKCLVGNASAWTPGLTLEKTIALGSNHILLTAAIEKKESEYFIVRLSWPDANVCFAELLHHAGLIPLPPYIRREAQIADAERYQTVYARSSGSVAAPTAGLHFTEEIIDRLAEKNITKDFVTLHVGAGTFMPVKSEKMEHHEMHAEFIEVSLSLIKNILAFDGKNITAVGTTSLRTLESLYWLGRKILIDPDLPEADLHVRQWEPYDAAGPEASVSRALNALIQYMVRRGKDVVVTRTSLLIAPGYKFRIVNALVTNFHQPKSTLLLLVAAFIGEKWKSAYSYALANDFRFLSYGDACLLFRQ